MSKIKKPIYGPTELDESKLTKQEVAVEKRKATLHKIRERRIKKAFRTYRLRGLKNFLFWFFGVLSGLAILVGSVFVGIKVVPLGTYLKWTGQDVSEIVSEKVSDKSVIDAIAGINEYSLEDLPVIESVVQGLFEETGIDDFVLVDYDALKKVKFFNASEGSDLMDEISKCVKLNPEMELLSDLKAFNEYSKTDCPIEKPFDGAWVLKENERGELYCFDTSTVGGNSLMNAPYVNQVVYEDVIVGGQINSRLASLTVAEMENVKFYYKPIKEMPLFDVVNGIDAIIGRLEIPDIITLVADGGEVDPLINKVFDGMTIGGITSDFDMVTMLEKVKLTDIEDVEEMLGDLGELSVFNEYVRVAEEEKPVVVEGKIEGKENPALFYYISKPAAGEEPAEYSRAFDNEGYRNENVDDNTELYYPNLLDVSITELLEVMGDSFGTIEINQFLEVLDADYSDEDFVATVLSGKKLNQISSITADEISLVDVFEYKGNEDIYKIILSGNQKLPVREVGETDQAYDARVQEEAEKINLKDLEGIDMDNINLDVVIPESENADLYEIIRKAKGMAEDEPVLLSCLDGFDGDDVYLSSMVDIPTEQNGYKNQKLYDILIDALVITDDQGAQMDNPSFSDIRVKHLSNFEMDRVNLNLVLPYYDAESLEDNRELYKILLEATGSVIADKNDVEIEAMAKELSIANIKSFDIGNVRIETAIINASKQLKDILGSSIVKNGNVIPYSQIQIKDLELFKVDTVKMDLILPYYDASDIENVIDNREMYKILVEACGLGKAEDAENIAKTMKVNDISNFDIEKVSLSAVLEVPTAANGYENQKLYDILLESLEITDENGYVISNATYSDISIKHLKSFSTDNLKLSTVLDNPNDTLKNVLTEACGTDFEEITINHLAGSGFDIESVKLSTVLTAHGIDEDGYPDYGNHILNVLMNKDADVNIGNIGDSLDNLLLSEVYPSESFTTTQRYSGQKAYYKIVRDGLDVYVHEDRILEFASSSDSLTTKYYVCNQAHIWLFLHYSNVWGNSYGGVILNGHDALGNAYVYVDAHHTLADLQGDVDDISGKIMDATIRQLVDGGLVNDNGGYVNTGIYSKSLHEVINEMGNVLI